MTTSTLKCPTCGRTPAQGCWTVSGHAPCATHTRQVDQSTGWDAGVASVTAAPDAVTLTDNGNGTFTMTGVRT